MLKNIAILRTQFPILSDTMNGQPLVYLDNAATTQKPLVLKQALEHAYYHANANIHRGTYALSNQATLSHEQAREQVASWLGARKKEEIVFTRGTTESLNLLAFSIGETYIKAGDEVLVSAMEHHSNLVPWQMMCERRGAVLKIVPLTPEHTFDMEAFRSMLTERVRLVSVAHVSNVLGVCNPVEEIISLAHKKGILVCLDGAQAIAHASVNVSQLDCDFYAFSAHKVYGPTGLGVLYGKEQYLSQMVPYQGGGEMIDHVCFDHTTYAGLPYRFEAGTPDYISSYAFARVLEWLPSRKDLRAHENELILLAQSELETIRGIRVFAPKEPKYGIISFVVDGVHPYDLGMLLDQQGIAVRTGHHCAEPLMGVLGISGTVRMSVGLYNTPDEIRRFVAALKRSLAMLQ